jgi:hypothetical protein
MAAQLTYFNPLLGQDYDYEAHQIFGYIGKLTTFQWNYMDYCW